LIYPKFLHTLFSPKQQLSRPTQRIPIPRDGNPMEFLFCQEKKIFCAQLTKFTSLEYDFLYFYVHLTEQNAHITPILKEISFLKDQFGWKVAHTWPQFLKDTHQLKIVHRISSMRIAKLTVWII
jgi:hypothetical protein